MTLTNQTTRTLTIWGETLNPSETQEFPEAMYSIMEIWSKEGDFCKITTRGMERNFENHGCLVALEGLITDENGLKNILIQMAS